MEVTPESPTERRPLPAALVLVALLDFATAAVLALGAIAALAFLGFPGARGLAALALPIGLLAGLYVVGGVAILLRSRGTRGRQIVLSSFGLLGFPVGTLLHGAILVLFATHRGVVAIYSGRPEERWSTEETDAVERLRRAKAPAVAGALALVAVGGLFVLGLFSAIAIPNFLSAVDRGKQKRTLADIRTIAMAVESFAVDHEAYPDATDLAELRKILDPHYVHPFPMSDGWGHALVFETFEEGGYRIRSYGKDGLPDEAPGGPTKSYADDIIFEDGQFVQWPEGTDLGGGNAPEPKPLPRTVV